MPKVDFRSTGFTNHLISQIHADLLTSYSESNSRLSGYKIPYNLFVIEF